MMKWCKRCLLYALIAMFGMLVMGCSLTAQEEKKEKDGPIIGFSQLGSESSWRLGNTKSIIQAAEERGIGMMYLNAHQSIREQIDAVRSFISYQVDAIVLAPIVETGWDDVLEEAKNANIPVILVDREIDTKDESLYVCHIGSDFYREGMMAGRYLKKKADELGMVRLKIVTITGTEGSTPMLERLKGFFDCLEGDERFVLLDSVCGDFIRSKGQEQMTALLKKYGSGIDVLFAQNDDMMKGAVEAIENAGLVPGKDIIVISVDGDQEAIDMLKAGRINCVVECTPMIGGLVMDIVEALQAGKPVEREYLSDETVFTEYDDLSNIKPRGY